MSVCPLDPVLDIKSDGADPTGLMGTHTGELSIRLVFGDSSWAHGRTTERMDVSMLPCPGQAMLTKQKRATRSSGVPVPSNR